MKEKIKQRELDAGWAEGLKKAIKGQQAAPYGLFVKGILWSVMELPEGGLGTAFF